MKSVLSPGNLIINLVALDPKIVQKIMEFQIKMEANAMASVCGHLVFIGLVMTVIIS